MTINSYLLLLLATLAPPFASSYSSHRIVRGRSITTFPPAQRLFPSSATSTTSATSHNSPSTASLKGTTHSCTSSSASEILKAQDHIFCNRANLTATHHLFYGGVDIAFSPYDDHWKLLRRLCNTEVFSPVKVQSFAANRKEEVDALIGRLSRASSHGEVVNLSNMVLCFFNNIFCRVLFGKRMSKYEDGGKIMHQDHLRETAPLMVALSMGDLIPSLRWLDVVAGWRAKLDNCFRIMDQLLEEEIEEHLKSTDAHEDFLDARLHLQAKKEDTSLYMNEIKAFLMILPACFWFYDYFVKKIGSLYQHKQGITKNICS